MLCCAGGKAMLVQKREWDLEGRSEGGQAVTIPCCHCGPGLMLQRLPVCGAFMYCCLSCSSACMHPIMACVSMAALHVLGLAARCDRAATLIVTALPRSRCLARSNHACSALFDVAWVVSCRQAGLAPEQRKLLGLPPTPPPQ